MLPFVHEMILIKLNLPEKSEIMYETKDMKMNVLL